MYVSKTLLALIVCYLRDVRTLTTVTFWVGQVSVMSAKYFNVRDVRDIKSLRDIPDVLEYCGVNYSVMIFDNCGYLVDDGGGGGVLGCFWMFMMALMAVRQGRSCCPQSP